MNKKTIYALGFFDGVHLGHIALLTACQKLAEESGCNTGVITFSSHPDTLVTGVTPGLIHTLEDREQLLKTKFHIREVIALPFHKAMMQMHWEDFLQMLFQTYPCGGFVCGYDFRFGNRGEGNAQLLQAVCQKRGIPCRIIPEETLDGITVSSTYIRSLLMQGQVEQANRFLGHPYRLTGEVIQGKQLGRTIGIPTANLKMPPELVQPKTGVYACKAMVEGDTYLAVTNIGTRPTVSGEGITVEAFLLDFSGNLYGKELTLTFYAYLRPEQKFPTLEQLQQEIRKNAQEVREIFAKT